MLKFFFLNLFVIFVIPLFILKFIGNFNHLFNSLLTLEMVSLNMFFVIVLLLNSFDKFYMIYFLTMIVCEGVLGLCLLVSMSMVYGNDYLFVLNKLMC